MSVRTYILSIMKLTTADVAKRLKITERHVRRLIDEEKLSAEKGAGKDWLITETSVRAFELRNEKIKAAMDSFVQKYGSTMMVMSTETSNRMVEDGLPIQSKFIPFDEYLISLFQEKRKQAGEKIKQLPLLDDDLGDAVAASLYNEFRECFVLGVNGAAITLAIMLLEYAMKRRIYIEQFENKQQPKWEDIESMSFIGTVSDLKKYITNTQHKALLEFNDTVRNNYIHYKVKNLISDANMYIEKLPVLNTNTGEAEVLENVEIKTMPQLWFSAKRKLDEDVVIGISTFCIKFVNKLLGSRKNRS